MNSLKLLYIEDDVDIQQIYLNFLKNVIDIIYCANDGEEGYNLYLEYKPDIILLDINMPKIDGLTLAKRIRRVDKGVKIIITTSYAEQDKLLQAIELYLIRYIIKPIELETLKNAVEKAKREIAEERDEQSIFLLDRDTVWDSKSKQLTRDGHEIKLTKNERRLLELLSRDKNKVFSFFEIFD
ncbi:MAG: response regulator transcription factor, partial [Epsilonproteobacteria bacterium]|nr:response regulator transcription factor [Campylobacterota bacterium]